MAVNADANITMAPARASRGRSFLASGGTPLPPDLAQQAVSRVRIAAWIFSGMWALVILMNDWLFAGTHGAPGIAWTARQTTLTVIGLLASLGMGWLTTRIKRPDRLFDIALAFLVLTALLVSLLTEYFPRTEPQAISWVCLVILTLPTIAPSSPRKTLLAALLAATTVPIALFYTRYANPGYDPPTSVMVWLILPPYLSAVLAMIPATVIRGLGRQVKRARELGSYQLDEKIASGGMGDVYRATHRLLARPAAVKLISPAVLNPVSPDATRVAVERFRREAQAAATLRSPHTIELYDYGVADDGTFYYVMELLDGIDLNEMVQSYGAQPAERVAHLLAQACDSLGEAHFAGLVHRDVKPSNIVACRMGLSVDYVKVLDFGLVKQTPSRTEIETNLTTVGAVSGTPAYMAPESISGIGYVGPAADVYALGCVAYWLLTGQTVFKGTNATMMMMQHLQASPVPPSLRSRTAIPADFESIVMRCLAKDPDDRPPDAAELARLLKRLRFSSAWTESRAEDWWKKHREQDTSAAFMTGSIVVQ